MNKLICRSIVIVYSLLVIIIILVHFQQSQVIRVSTSNDLITSKTSESTLESNPKIAILVIGDHDAEVKYSQYWSSLRCYANRHNYTFLHDKADIDSFSECQQNKNYFFRKHCVVAQIMKRNYQIDWFLVLDGDVFVVNANRDLLSYIPSNNKIDIVHYERFHNGEIGAGNYLIKNTIFGSEYVKEWSRWEFHKSPVPNYDNGALHTFLLSRLFGNQSKEFQTCHSLFIRSIGRSLSDYDSAVGCTKCALGKRRIFLEQRIQIIRRGHFAVRDFFVSSMGDKIQHVTNIGIVSSQDIFFHGYKERLVDIWWKTDVNLTACDSIWTPELVPSVIASIAETKVMIRERDRYCNQDRPNSVLSADVGDCWPNCSIELDQGYRGKCGMFEQ